MHSTQHTTRNENAKKWDLESLPQIPPDPEVFGKSGRVETEVI
jgi:hypothetical protein